MAARCSISRPASSDARRSAASTELRWSISLCAVSAASRCVSSATSCRNLAISVCRAASTSPELSTPLTMAPALGVVCLLGFLAPPLLFRMPSLSRLRIVCCPAWDVRFSA
eukprot:545954-Prymnesium_polylepis.1